MSITQKGKKQARQKKGPLIHYMSTMSHNYGQTMLYPLVT